MLKVDIEKQLDRYTLKVNLQSDASTLALFGASGAGKSMTLKCIAGIEKPDKGVIQLNGRVLFDSERKINLPPQKRRVGYLFQEYALFPDMSVSDNISAGMHRLSKSERKERLHELISQFQLEGLEKRSPDLLSGGEKQRVALARIFASSPEVLLLDEPFSSLDTLLKLRLIPYIRDVIASFGGETILVSHDLEEVRRLCPAINVITDGVTSDQLDTESFLQQLSAQTPHCYER